MPQVKTKETSPKGTGIRLKIQKEQISLSRERMVVLHEREARRHKVPGKNALPELLRCDHQERARARDRLFVCFPCFWVSRAHTFIPVSSAPSLVRFPVCLVLSSFSSIA